MVFMGIVGMFLACHALRIFLSLHEMTIIRDAMKCHNLERRGFPVWAEITTTFRQVFYIVQRLQMQVIMKEMNEKILNCSSFRFTFLSH